jgi:hypothetical protein
MKVNQLINSKNNSPEEKLIPGKIGKSEKKAPSLHVERKKKTL